MPISSARADPAAPRRLRIQRLPPMLLSLSALEAETLPVRRSSPMTTTTEASTLSISRIAPPPSLVSPVSSRR